MKVKKCGWEIKEENWDSEKSPEILGINFNKKYINKNKQNFPEL